MLIVSIPRRNSMVNLDWKLLTAFEAVARHANFSRAAGELNVQQPAISRRVAELEGVLGVKLLRRTRPNTTLTEEGQILFKSVSSSVLQVANAVDEIRHLLNRDVVTVKPTLVFACFFLMKRLSSFRSQFPEVSIELVSRDQNDSYSELSADVVIVFDEPQKLPGIRHSRIFPEVMVPMARPDIAESIGNSVKSLSNHKLLYLTMGIHGDDWSTYFDGTGVELEAPGAEQKYTSFMVYLQAALDGEGCMLGWDFLMRYYIKQGLLMPVGNRRMKTDRGYFVCLAKRAKNNPAAGTVFEWLSKLETD
ncbi:MAG: LysR family transcriptional regulator [Pseudomonadota bacterium]